MKIVTKQITTITKLMIAELLSYETNASLKIAKEHVKALTDTLTGYMVSGHTIALRGHGKLECLHKVARPVRNPKTGEEMVMPPRYTYVLRKNGSPEGKVSQGQLLESMQTYHGLSTIEAKTVWDLFISALDSIRSDPEAFRLEIRGIGTFTGKSVEPRMARNPKTGTTAMTKPSVKLHFKRSSLIHKAINK